MAKIGQRRGGGSGTGTGSRTVSGGGGTPAVHLSQNGNSNFGLVLGLQHEEAGPDWAFFGNARRTTPTLPVASLAGSTGGSSLRIQLPERFIQPSTATGWNVRVTQGQPAVAEVAATAPTFDIHTNAAGTQGIRVTLAAGAVGNNADITLHGSAGSLSRFTLDGAGAVLTDIFIPSTATAADVLGQFYVTAGTASSGILQLAVTNPFPELPTPVNITSVAYFGGETGTSVIGGLTLAQISGRTSVTGTNVDISAAADGTSGTDAIPAVARTPLSASLDETNKRINITAVSTDTLNQIVAIVRPVTYPVQVTFDAVDGYSSTSGTTGAFSEGSLISATGGSATLSSTTFFGGAVGASVDVAFSVGTDQQTILITANETAQTVSLRYASSDSQQTLLDYLDERSISGANVTFFASEIYNTNLSVGLESPPISARPFLEYYPEGSAGSGGSSGGSGGLNTAAVDTRINTIVNKSFVDALDIDADTLDGLDSSALASAGSGSLVVTHKGTNTFDPITATTDITVDDIWYVIAASGTTGDLVGRENKLVRRTAPNTYEYEAPEEGSIHDLTSPTIDTDDDQPIIERIMFRSGEWRSTSEGIDNTSSGIVAHAEGRGNTASGEASHAEGINNTASGVASHAAGRNNEARGDASYAGGDDARAVGNDSFAHGENVTAIPFDSFIIGKNGVIGRNSTLFGIANGAHIPDETVRSTTEDLNLILKITDNGVLYASDIIIGDVDEGSGLSVPKVGDAAADLGGVNLHEVPGPQTNDPLEYGFEDFTDQDTYDAGPSTAAGARGIIFNSATVATATEFKISLYPYHAPIFDALVNSNSIGTTIDVISGFDITRVWCGHLVSVTANDSIRTVQVTPNENNPELSSSMDFSTRILVHGHWEVEVDERIREIFSQEDEDKLDRYPNNPQTMGAGRTQNYRTISNDYFLVDYDSTAFTGNTLTAGQIMIAPESAGEREVKIHFQDEDFDNDLTSFLEQADDSNCEITFTSQFNSSNVFSGDMVSATSLPYTGNVFGFSITETSSIAINDTNFSGSRRVAIRIQSIIDKRLDDLESRGDGGNSGPAGRMRIFPETLADVSDFEGTHWLVLDELDETVLNNSAIDTFRLDHEDSNINLHNVTWTLNGGTREFQIDITNAEYLSMNIGSADYIELVGIFYDDTNSIDIARTAPLLIPVQDVNQFPASRSDLPGAPMILQAAVDGGNTAGVASITLPTNYTNWRNIEVVLWRNNGNRIGRSSLRTAVIAAQTGDRNIVLSGNLGASNLNNAGALTWDQSARTLTAQNSHRIIFAELFN